METEQLTLMEMFESPSFRAPVSIYPLEKREGLKKFK